MATTKFINLNEAKNPFFKNLKNGGFTIESAPNESKTLIEDTRRNVRINGKSYQGAKEYSSRTITTLAKEELGTQFDDIYNEYTQEHISTVNRALQIALGSQYQIMRRTSYVNLAKKGASTILSSVQSNFAIFKPSESNHALFYIHGPATLYWELNAQKKLELKTALVESKLISDIINCETDDIKAIIKYQKLLDEYNAVKYFFNDLLQPHKTNELKEKIAALENDIQTQLPVSDGKRLALKKIQVMYLTLENAPSESEARRQVLRNQFRDLEAPILSILDAQVEQWIDSWPTLYPDDFGTRPKYFLGENLKNSFHEIFNPNSFRSDFASFFGYPRPTNPFHWFEYIFMGWLLNPIKNTIKFVLEFLPTVIEKTAKWGIEELLRKFPTEATISNPFLRYSAKAGATMAIGILGLAQYTTKIISLVTARFSSPMRSVKEAFYWGRSINPALGYAAALLSLTISAAGVATIAFFAAPLLGFGISAYAIAGIAAGAWAGLSALRAGIRKLTFAVAEKMKKENAQTQAVANKVELPLAQEKEKQIESNTTAFMLQSFSAQSGNEPVICSPIIQDEPVKSPSPEAKPTENTATIVCEQKSDVEIAMEDHPSFTTKNWQWATPRHTFSEQHDSDTVQPRL